MMRKCPVLLAFLLICQCLATAQLREPASTTAKGIIRARPLPLNSVRLTGGPLKNAQDLDAKYLLELQPDRMMAFLRRQAGLTPKAEGYGGWDGPGRQLTGHIAGHYLSAVSLMWAATGDVRFKERADYLVRELKDVQDKHGDGYIGALMDNQNVTGKTRFEELSKGIIRSSGFDLNGLWSPWYVQHKIYAGLRDAYRLTGSRAALDVEVKFAAWAESILATLDDKQVQQMLNTEFGGMNEVAADLYADTGDPRWLALSEKFYHRAIIEPLATGNDILAGKHGNTLVPKLIGHLSRYIYTGAEADGKAARFFWDQVALHHSFATGGHGKNEYFGQPDKLNDMIDGRTAETCNVYNMLKMTHTLFSVEPAVRYADFHERALFNHILGSMDPEDGRTCYMVPVGRGVQHEYQDMARSFTCCVGSGMESHALHGDGIYYESGDKLWVNLYVPTSAEWAAAGMRLEVSAGLPEGDSASLKLTAKSPRKFTLALRRPYWAGPGFRVAVNGRAVAAAAKGGYLEVNRTWKTGDVVEVTLPKSLRVEALPDNPRRIALMWGPLVLAGDLGPEQQRGGRRAPQGDAQAAPPVTPPPAPVFLAAEQPVDSWLKPVADKPGSFRTEGVGRDHDVDLVPFYRLHRRRYAIYWDVFTPAEWRKKAEEHAAEQEKQKKIEAATGAGLGAFAQGGGVGTFTIPGAPAVAAPPESMFEKMRGDRDMPRRFYKKYVDIQGMPAMASDDVADLALQRTWWIVTHVLAGRPDILQAMVKNGTRLIIIGKDQVYTDMPEYRNSPNPEFQNERVRGTGGFGVTSFGEENLLSLPLDRYDDESIAVHEFCHTIDAALRAIDPTWNQRKNGAYQKARELPCYKDTYAGSNAGEYWAEIAQAYFDCNRVNNWNHGPVGTRERLRALDPAGYELVHATFNLRPDQDWRYAWLQKLPSVTAPPAKFKIDPYYTKFTWAREFTVVGRQARDEGLLKANDTIRKMFAYRHDILKALSADGAKLVVLGKKERISYLPELAKIRGTPGFDPRARGADYRPDAKLLVVGEEEVLVGGDRDCEVIRRFARAIHQVTGTRPVDPAWESRPRQIWQQYELRVRRMDVRFDEKLKELHETATARGLWKGTPAAKDRVDYWAAGVLAYFDAAGRKAGKGAPRPIVTREMLKEYDPGLYALVNETMAYEGRVDWRYSFR